MTFNFKYNRRKEAMLDNPFSPGQTSGMGKDGVAGNKGKQGASLYFINYEPDNDFVKDLLLNKIDNNIILSSDKGKRLPNEKCYVSGDLILTSNYYMYQIVNAEDGSKYKFDIKFIGELRDTSTENMSDEAVLSRLIQGVALNEKTSQASAIRRSLVPVSRSMDSSKDALDVNDQDVDRVYKEMFSSAYAEWSPSLPFNKVEDSMSCVEIRPAIILNKSMEQDADNYDFYLKIYLRNKKTPVYDSTSYQLSGTQRNAVETRDMSGDAGRSTMQDNFTFYKYIEIPLYKTFPDQIDLDTIPSYYLTEMSMDKAHPSGNNIVSLLVIPEAGYKNVVRNYSNGLIGYVTNLRFDLFGNAAIPQSNGLFTYSSTSINYPTVYRLVRDADFSLIKLQYDLSTYRDACNLIQYSKRFIPDCDGIFKTMPNFRGGESSYFSGMTTYLRDDASYTIDGSVYTRLFVNNTSEEETDCTINGNYKTYATNIRSLNYNIPMDDSSSYSEEYPVVDEDCSDCPDIAQNALIARRQCVMDTVKKEMEKFIFSSNNIFELSCVNKTTGKVYNIETIYSR